MMLVPIVAVSHSGFCYFYSDFMIHGGVSLYYDSFPEEKKLAYIALLTVSQYIESLPLYHDTALADSSR